MEPTFEGRSSNNESPESEARVEERASAVHETRRRFSEPAKENMLNMLREMVDEDPTRKGYFQAQPSLEAMTILHEEMKTGLIDDKEVVEVVQKLVNSLRKRTDQKSSQLLGFLEDHFLVMDEGVGEA